MSKQRKSSRRRDGESGEAEAVPMPERIDMKDVRIGVDLGGTTVKLGLFREEALLDKWEIPTRKENQGAGILVDIKDSIEEKLDEHAINKNEILGVGIGVPGPVDADGIVHECVNLGWGTFNVEKELEGLLNLPVKAGNDANVAALGEQWQGGGKGCHSMVMITLGTGVGGGIILDGKILAGTNGAAGEIGHMPVVYDETEYCNCGKKGCLEQAASATGIVKTAKRLLAASEAASALREKEELTAKDVFDEAKNGDELAVQAVEKLGEYLGIATAHVACVADPQVFVIGGGVSKAGEVLISTVEKYYREKAFKGSRGAQFKLAMLGNDAGIYGAAKLI